MIPLSKPSIGDAEKAAVMRVLDSGMLAQGPEVAELETRFADLCGVKHAVATSSGTTALYLALLANGIGPGDEVITSPFTFIASANAILFTGARPVFVDIQQDTLNIDPQLVEKAVTGRTRAILPVHLYGHMCDMDALQGIAQHYGLKLIEDACQAVGATYKGRPAGSFGTAAFSLYATKNVMTGEGGMITTNDGRVANQCRLLRQHGMQRRYYHERLGYNFRLSDIHAAIGVVQMSQLETFTNARRRNAEYLSEHLRTVVTPAVGEGIGHVWHQYTVRVTAGRNRDRAMQRLEAAGVGTGIFYPVPVHKHAYMREIVGDVSLPMAERAAEEVFSLPVHPLLTPEDLETIVREVNLL